MIAELGLAALWLAAALAALQMSAGFLALRAGNATELAALIRPAAIVQGVLVTFSFAMLVWLFAITDLSVKLVASNSHSLKPLVFKLSGTWGNHEGSMLLWVMVMGLAGALIALVERRLSERTMNATLAAQGVVSLGFYAFLLLSSNPFERLPVPAAEGMGLNPLLQDIGLAPPTLYLGYVGLSVAFSFAVGALLTRQVTISRVRCGPGCWPPGSADDRDHRGQLLGLLRAWLGRLVVLGPGRERLAHAMAGSHCAAAFGQRPRQPRRLRTWTIMLGVVAFSMSMVGTFLVRSGILTSVHAFAVDPERGTFILVLLGIFIGGALLLFALRANTISEGERFALASREGALVFNNVMLSAILAIVLLGTLYPLLTEAFDVRVSVGPPYFNPVGAIFAIPMFAVMAVGPLLRWREDRIDRIGKEVALTAALVVAALVLTSLLTEIGLLPLLGLAFGIGLAVASWLPLRGRNLARTPLAT